MLLADIIKNVRIEEIIGDVQRDIADVHIDSRRVAEGHLFVAMRGTQVDGHKYIQSAIDKGAAAIVCEQLPETLAEGVTYLRVADSEEVVGPIATAFNGYPTETVRLIGVTGTNGKTTIATLLYDMFRAMGYKVGLLSTVCNYIDGEAIPTEHTTPDAITLNALLGRMANEGCKYVFMEVSSHSVAQRRIGGLKFAGGIFTNLTRDHMDYHKTVDNYLRAKKAFFDALPKDAFVVTNLDDKNGLVMTQNTRAKVHTYSLRSLADFKGRILEHYFDGMMLEVNNVEVFVQFIGKFNASNLLAVYGTACLLGKRPEEVLTVLSMLRPVNGRFDAVHSPQGFTAIVDYAHTPDALENIINTIDELRNNGQRLIVVCGCGGDRDKTKRPVMGGMASKRGDIAIFTSDNPRTEDPEQILREMEEGVEPGDKYLKITDRHEAIKTAVMLAEPGDIILLAGKGHEDYQIVGTEKLPFNDKSVVKEYFAKFNR